MTPHDYRELSQISLGYARVGSRLPKYYSPVCQASEDAFDLHVLGAPPAFILSQDQTLS